MSVGHHGDIRERLRDAFDVARPAELPADLAQHLRECAECAALASDRYRVAASLRALPLVEPPAELAQRIFAEAARIDRLAPRIGRRGLLRRVLVVAPLAAAAAIALFAWVKDRDSTPPQRPIIVYIDGAPENSDFSDETLQETLRRLDPSEQRG
jgi:hypothetical protein